MRILKHIAFIKSEDPVFWNYCQAHQIPVEQTADDELTTLDIYTDNEHWPWVENHLTAYPTFCLSSTEFSKEELQAASWMSVRSIWRSGYPEPSTNYAYESITYSSESACPHCLAGLKQVSPFRTKKIPS